MDARARHIAAGVGTAILFLAVQLGALALVDPFMNAGFQAVEDPADPTNSFVYLGAILVATAVMLAVIKLGIDHLLRALIVGMSGVLSLYVFSVVIPPVIVHAGFNLIAWVAAGTVVIALYVYPEWYVIDAAGGAGLFGISFGPLPAVLLLVVLAIYDAVSVYQTKHMLTLAEGVAGLKLPLVLIVPLTSSYSFLDDAALPPAAEAGGGDSAATDGAGDATPVDPELDREAFFIGLGDTVMPTIMVASAAFFLPAPALPVPGIALNLPALFAMVGTFVGLGGLLWLVAKGRAHAGLPLLNGGAIGGYLLGAVLSGFTLVDALGLGPYL